MVNVSVVYLSYVFAILLQYMVFEFEFVSLQAQES